MPIDPLDPGVLADRNASDDCAVPCQSFGAGHSIHPIQARLLVEKLWGWRAATVRFVEGREAIVEYPCGTDLLIWHHRVLDRRVLSGQGVQIHEGLGAIALPAGKGDEEGTRRALSVDVRAGGLGAVLEPAIAVLPRRRLAILELQTGEAIVDIEPLIGSVGDNQL